MHVNWIFYVLLLKFDLQTLTPKGVILKGLSLWNFVSDICMWVILLKTGQNCDIEGKNSEWEFFMLLFGNESLTALMYINIRHKLTGWQELG